MPDLHEYLSPAAYGIIILFYSIVTIGPTRYGPWRPYSKPFARVLAIHAMFLSGLLVFETALLLAYRSLPDWLTAVREVERVHFSMAAVAGIVVFCGAIAWERSMIYAGAEKDSPAEGSAH